MTCADPGVWRLSPHSMLSHVPLPLKPRMHNMKHIYEHTLLLTTWSRLGVIRRISRPLLGSLWSPS